MIKWTGPILGAGNGKGSSRSETKPSRSDEKEQGRSRDDARGSGVDRSLPNRLHTHARSRWC
jgi:hypothetical protein